jgi:hypothetical protein
MCYEVKIRFQGRISYVTVIHPQKVGYFPIGMFGLVKCENCVDFGHRQSVRHHPPPSAGYG